MALTRIALGGTTLSPYPVLLGDPDFKALFGTVSPAAAAWPVANLGIVLPHYQPVDAYLISMQMGSNSATGTLDMAVYASNLSRLVSRGATANVNAIATFTLTTPLFMRAGTLYLVAAASSSITPSFIKSTITVINGRLIGMAQQASVATLPDPLVPAQFAQTYCPVIMLNFSTP